MTSCERRPREAYLRWRCAGCRVGAPSPATEYPFRRRDVPTGSRSYGPLTAPPTDTALLQETVVVTHDQLRLDHLDSIHCHADHNQQRRATEIEIHPKSLRKPLRQSRVEPGPDQGKVLDVEAGIKKFGNDRD